MELLVETFRNHGEPSTAPVRVRPVAGQTYPSTMRVACSRSRREQSSLGSFFVLSVQLVSKPAIADYLHSHYNDRWREMTRDDAAAFIAASRKVSSGTELFKRQISKSDLLP